MTDQTAGSADLHPTHENEVEISSIASLREEILLVCFLFKFHGEGDESDQIPINVNEESTDHIPDGLDDQLEEISPPTPRIRPIIAPDMFPPFVKNFTSRSSR